MVTLNLNESKAVAKTATNFFCGTKHRDACIENNTPLCIKYFFTPSICKKNVKPPILGLVIAKSDLKKIHLTKKYW